MISTYPILRRILFRLDPERAHHGAVAAARIASEILRRLPGGARALRTPRLEQRLCGIDFPNPIGLAAGFDKNGVAPHLWPALGFGFAELGTVTGRAQPGNPAPRLFRLAEDRALINRLGFNGDGADAVARGLSRRLQPRPRIPVGINVGCSRAAVGDEAAEAADHRASVRALGRFADYLAVNLSSPNTPGLRGLQDPRRLAAVARVVGETLAEIDRPNLPVLLKVAPDLADADVAPVCRAGLEAGVAGFIAGNTTVARAALSSRQRDEAGGLSGAPLRERATRLVALVREAVGPLPVVVGVGGVMAPGDVLEKLDAGADLVGLYTGLVFEGPLLAARLAHALDAALERSGETMAGRAASRRPARAARTAGD